MFSHSTINRLNRIKPRAQTHDGQIHKKRNVAPMIGDKGKDYFSERAAGVALSEEPNKKPKQIEQTRWYSLTGKFFMS